MSKFEKYRGMVKFEIDGEEFILNKITVEDKGRLIALGRENNYEKLLLLMKEILVRHYSDIPTTDIDGFLLKNSEIFFVELLASLGLGNRDEAIKKIEEVKSGNLPKAEQLAVAQ